MGVCGVYVCWVLWCLYLLGGYGVCVLGVYGVHVNWRNCAGRSRRHRIYSMPRGKRGRLCLGGGNGGRAEPQPDRTAGRTVRGCAEQPDGGSQNTLTYRLQVVDALHHQCTVIRAVVRHRLFPLACGTRMLALQSIRRAVGRTRVATIIMANSWLLIRSSLICE